MVIARTVRDSRSALLLSGAALCALLAACGSSTPNAPSTTSATSATSAAGPSAGGSSGAAGATTTLTGTIEAGVESGCIVLVGDDGTVLANLVDVDTVTVPVGSTIEVTGTFEEDMMTTCQQGEPFSITTITVR